MLHYISYGDHEWRKCPICYDPIKPIDLKPGIILRMKKITGSRIENPIEINLVLMKRNFVSCC